MASCRPLRRPATSATCRPSALYSRIDKFARCLRTSPRIGLPKRANTARRCYLTGELGASVADDCRAGRQAEGGKRCGDGDVGPDRPGAEDAGGGDQDEDVRNNVVPGDRKSVV